MRRRLFLVQLCLGIWMLPLQSASAQTVAPYDLVDHLGRPFSSTSLAGRPHAVFFGFTHCPDICPTTLLEMSNHLEALGPDADKLGVIFISVDPERDKPDALREYLGSFDSRIVGLTGSEQQVKAAVTRFKAFYDRLPEGDGTYTVVHSAYVYLVDASEKTVATMGFNEPELEQRKKLRALLGLAN